MSFVLKVVSTGINYYLVPLLLGVLSKEDYGIWITLSTMLIWSQFFDVGLGNGLKNYLSQAVAREDVNEQASVVGTGAIAMLLIGTTLFCALSAAVDLIDWNSFFGVSRDRPLDQVLRVVGSLMILQFLLSITTSIFQALRVYSIGDVFASCTQFLSLLYVLAVKYESGCASLESFAITMSAIPSVVLSVITLYLIYLKWGVWKFRVSMFSWRLLKNIANLGLGFMITKAGALMIVAADTFLITSFIDASSVVDYNVTYKYFGVVLLLFSVIANPLWVAFNDAWTKDDFSWIRNTINKLLKLWAAIPFALLIMWILGPWVFDFWSAGKLQFQPILGGCMALYMAVYTFNSIFNQFINGVGKIRVNVLISVIILILNIPLSRVLSIDLDLGVTGILIATLFLVLLKAATFPYQYWLIISKRSYGIWAK